uniref:Uncharacterized protein n=1 Tax=Apteryx owenii TaxID=8824 RepID=A0A8B9PNJ5_APTOW
MLPHGSGRRCLRGLARQLSSGSPSGRRWRHLGRGASSSLQTQGQDRPHHPAHHTQNSVSCSHSPQTPTPPCCRSPAQGVGTSVDLCMHRLSTCAGCAPKQFHMLQG